MAIVNKAAYEIPGFKLGVIEANIDMSGAGSGENLTYQFTGVDVGPATGAGLTGPAGLIAPVSAGAAIIGILQNNPQLAEVGVVVCSGVSKAKYGATITVGEILAVTSAGLLSPATSGQYGVAKALEAGANGDTACVLVMNFGKQ